MGQPVSTQRSPQHSSDMISNQCGTQMKTIDGRPVLCVSTQPKTEHKGKDKEEEMTAINAWNAQQKAGASYRIAAYWSRLMGARCSVCH